MLLGQAPAARGAAAWGAADAALALTVSCPRLGARLAVGRAWAALAPAPPARPFELLEAALAGVRLALAPDGARPNPTHCLGGLQALHRLCMRRDMLRAAPVRFRGCAGLLPGCGCALRGAPRRAACGVRPRREARAAACPPCRRGADARAPRQAVSC